MNQARSMEVNACMLLLLTVSVLRSIELAEASNVNLIRSMVHSQTIRRSIDTSIVKSSFMAKSLIQCTAICMDVLITSLYFDEIQQLCHCNSDVDTSTEYDVTQPEKIYGTIGRIIKESITGDVIKREVIPHRQDCLDLFNDGFTQDGVYTILPAGGTASDTWCDMADGGWTIFQRRLTGDEDFYRGWEDYKAGFGNPASEYWLGLESVHLLTQQPSELSIVMVTFGDVTPTDSVSNFSSFSLSAEGDNYRLSAGGYSGTCSDPFYHDNDRWNAYNKPWTTIDRDNDNALNYNCAIKYKGAWWHSDCFVTNLNSYYRGGRFHLHAQGMVSQSCWGNDYSVKTTVMKLRRA